MPVGSDVTHVTGKDPRPPGGVKKIMKLISPFALLCFCLVSKGISAFVLTSNIKQISTDPVCRADLYSRPMFKSILPIKRQLSMHRNFPELKMNIFDFLSPKKAIPGISYSSPSSSQARPRVPQNYDEIHEQSFLGIEAGLRQGLRRMEVEFPPIPQVNRLSDGSASSQAMVRRANVAYAAKAAARLAPPAPARLHLLCGDRATLDELLRAALPKTAAVGLLRDFSPAAAGPGDAALVVTPADAQQWAAAARVGDAAPVAVLNGVFNNGWPGFESAYYLRPMTFNSGVCGYLLRQFPAAWTVPGPARMSDSVTYLTP